MGGLCNAYALILDPDTLRSCNLGSEHPPIYALAIWCDPELALANNLAG